MKKKTSLIILILTSIAAVVFAGGKIVATTDVNGDEEVLILRDDDSTDYGIFSTGANLGKVPGIINSAFLFVPAIIALFSVVIFLLYSRTFFVNIISARGPPGSARHFTPLESLIITG